MHYVTQSPESLGLEAEKVKTGKKREVAVSGCLANCLQFL